MSNDIFQIFFIVSNKTILEKDISYSISKSKAFINFKNILKLTDHVKAGFTTYVYFFEIIQKYLKNNEVEIKLKYKKNEFKRSILFQVNSNNFIYDFKFNPKYISKGNYLDPPEYIDYPKEKQLEIYSDTLKKLNLDYPSKLYKNLINYSVQKFEREEQFKTFEYYLELLKLCFSHEEMKYLLEKFNISANFKYNVKHESIIKYSSFLNQVRNNDSLIASEDKKYIKLFYNLLLFFTYNYEKEKVTELINDKK